MSSGFLKKTVARGVLDKNNEVDSTLEDLSKYLGKKGVKSRVDGKRIVGESKLGVRVRAHFSDMLNGNGERKAFMTYSVDARSNGRRIEKHMEEIGRYFSEYEGPYTNGQSSD